jgi:3-oxoacyl-[acyl-carrier-protein] synthase II
VRQPVSIAGVGIVSVFGTSLDAFRDALVAGQTGIVPVKGFDTAGCRSTIAAEIAGFDPSPFVPPMKMRRMDRTAVYTIAATKLALDDAHVSIAAEGDDTTGVMLGTWTAGGGSTQVFLDALFKHGPTGAPALLFDSTVANSAASIAGLEHRLRGPNMTVSHKEASGLAAVVTAVDLLREGRATALAAGSADAIFETFFKAHERFAVMSPQRAPSARTSPFDACRDGFVLGEGAVILWLERAGASAAAHGGSSGSARGDILGVASASANVPLNAWPDRSEPLVRTMRLALDDAGLTPDDVDVVYASANATRQLDAVEAEALTTLFGGSRTVITTVKGATGESGTAGVFACAAALLCGVAGRVPPIAGLAEPDPATASLRLATTAVDAPGPIALINSFASGGALFSAVLRVRGQR